MQVGLTQVGSGGDTKQKVDWILSEAPSLPMPVLSRTWAGKDVRGVVQAGSMTHDDTHPTAGALLTTFATSIDAQDWDGLSALLADEFVCRYATTGEVFDKAGFIALNRDYPGRWRFELQDVVDVGERGVLRARVSDAAGESDESHFVATFATARAGLLVEIVEVWAEEASVPEDRRPSS